MSVSIGLTQQSSQAQSIITASSPNLAHFVDPVDSSTTISELRQLCEESVENIRQIIIHLGAVLKNTTYPQSRLSDIFATPQYVIEKNIDVLTTVHNEINARKILIKTVDKRPFCGSYFTVEDAKDFGYRGLDYVAAIVALSLVVLGTSESVSEFQNSEANSNELIVKGSFSAFLLVISKVLSAVTDYRNKKKYEREVELHQLDEISYKCKKAKEATGLLTILKSITNPQHNDCNESLRQFNLKTIEQLISYVDDPLDFASLKLLKKQISVSIEQKIKGLLKLKCPSLMASVNTDLIIKNAFLSWKSLKFDEVTTGCTQEAPIFAAQNPAALSPPNLLAMYLAPLPESKNSL